MKMVDCGMKPVESQVSPTKAFKKYYPSVSIEKDLGYKIGQKCILHGKVTGIRKDKYGNSVTIEVISCGTDKLSEKDFEKMSSEEQDDYLRK